MAYIINKYNGDQAASVDDGTINTTLDLKLIGKNYAGYGEAQNENFTWLLENFASLTAPPKAVIGQLWFDTTTQKLKVNNGVGKWRTLGVIEMVTANSSPKIADLEEGDFFWNTTNEQLWCKSATSNVLIGGKLTGISTLMKSSTVLSDTGVQYEIVEACINNVTTYVISSASSEFTLAVSEGLTSAGFLKIYPGITLKGVSSATYVSTDYKFWGTASDSQRLNGKLASEYINKTTPVFPNIANFSDAGMSIGLAGVERLFIYNDGSTPTIHNQSNDTIVFKTTDSTLPKTAMKLIGQDIIPGSAGNSNIGSSDQKFATIYATTFNGTATQATSLTLEGDSVAKAASAYRSDIDGGAVPDTVVVRTNQIYDYGGFECAPGAIQATYFMGGAFGVNAPGDLAEKYLPDHDYEPGTVLMIGGDAEVTASQAGYLSIGVVSTKPTIVMNLDLVGGVIVALTGRVPTKVIGKVTKGDRLIAADNGVATAFKIGDDSGLVFAVSLETNDSDEVKLVEALVR